MTETPWFLKDYKSSLSSSRGRIIPTVEQHLIRQSVADSEVRDTNFLHPSQICKKDWCPRSSWYTITSGEKQAETLRFNTLNIFAEGHAIHAKWQSWMAGAGLLEGMWSCNRCFNKWWAAQEIGTALRCPSCDSDLITYREVPISDEKHHLLGHADGIINDRKGKAVIEIKSIGMGTIRMENPDLFFRYQKKEITSDQVWKEIKHPFIPHLRQINLYMWVLGIQSGIVIYEWKASQDVKEFEVTLSENLITDIISSCLTVKAALESNAPPMRPVSASLDSSMCKNCLFYNRCWSIDEDQSESKPNTYRNEVRVTRKARNIRSKSSIPLGRLG